jgi:hypothetical protein
MLNCFVVIISLYYAGLSKFESNYFNLLSFGLILGCYSCYFVNFIIKYYTNENMQKFNIKIRNELYIYSGTIYYSWLYII